MGNEVLYLHGDMSIIREAPTKNPIPKMKSKHEFNKEEKDKISVHKK